MKSNKVHSLPPDIESGGEEEKSNGNGLVRVHRRSGIMNLIDFVRRLDIRRQHHHRKVVDLTQTINAAEMFEIESGAKQRSQRGLFCVELSQFQWRYIAPLMAWILWILIGTLFYCYSDGLGWELGFFESLNIGWSVGWVLPSRHSYEADALSTAFSLLHTVVGMLFMGLGVLFIANELESGNSGRGAHLRVGDLGRAAGQHSALLNLQTWCQREHRKVKICALFIAWIVVGCIWFWLSFRQGFLPSADYTVSTLAGAGYKGIPKNAPSYQYVLCALYGAVAIPLTRISEGLLIGILLVELKNKNLYEKIVQDMSDSEVEAMNNFCTRGDANFQYDENDLQDHLRLAEFTLLLALRVGTVSLETVSKIKQRFQTLDRRHEARISYDDVAYNNDTMRLPAERKLDFVDTSYSIRSFITFRKLLGSIRRKNEETQPIPSSIEKTQGGSIPTTSHHLKENEVSQCSLTMNSSNVHDMWSPSSMSSSVFTGSKSTVSFGNKHESAVIFKNRLSQVNVQAPAIHEIDSNPSLATSLSVLDEGGVNDAYHGRFRTKDLSDVNELSQPYKGRLTNLLTFEKTRVESFDETNDAILKANKRESIKSELQSPVVKPLLGLGKSQRFSKSRGIALSPQSHAEGGELKSPTLCNRQSEIAEDRSENESPHVDGNAVISNTVRIKLAAVNAFMSGLNEAKAIRDQRSRHPSILIYCTRSLVMLRRAHNRNAKRNAVPTEQSCIAFAAFYFFDALFNPQYQALLMWLMWILVGTVFFTLHYRVSLMMGFYHSINTGYGVFLTKPMLNESAHVYILVHLLFGTMIVSGSLTLLATYVNFAKHKRQLEALTMNLPESNKPSSPSSADNERSICYLTNKAKLILKENILSELFLLLVLSCTTWSCVVHHRSALDGLYFTVSMFSTSGQVSLPEESPDWHYLVVGCFACVGVPLMALSLGLFTHTIIRYGEQDQMDNIIRKKISQEELELLRNIGLEDGNGYLDISEFAILMLFRIGALHRDFLKLAKYRFMQLKEPGTALLSISKLGKNTNA